MKINGSFLFLIKKQHPPPLLTNNLFSKNIWNSIKHEENMKWYLFIFDNALIIIQLTILE